MDQRSIFGVTAMWRHQRTVVARGMGIVIALAASAASAQQGLVAAFSFDAGSGTVVEDSSGRGNTGTLENGATWTSAGKYGNAVYFNGTDAFITVNDADTLDLTTGLTLMAWVNPSANTGWRTVILKERPGGLAYSLYAIDNTGMPPSLTLNIGSDRVALGSSALPLNTWSHLAATYDGATMRIFVNGSQVRSVARTGSITKSASPLRIGGNTIWGEHFQGVIDEVRVYNRALTQAEIQSDMNTPISGTPPDVTPPVISNPLPSGQLPSGTTLVNLQVTTDESATCRYSVADVVYASMTTSFAETGGTTHQTPVATADGQIYKYYVRCMDTAGNADTASVVISFSVATVLDTTPPTVSITSPAQSATVSGTVNLSAAASDIVGIAGVQFLLDGANFGGEDLTSPYSASWDTTGVPNGSHTIGATARDTAGNRASAIIVSVNVDNGSVDTQPPTTPSNLLGFVISNNQINLAWDNSADNVGVAGYQVYRDGSLVATVAANSFKDTSVDAGSTHTYSVVAVDLASNPSAHSAEATATTSWDSGSPLNVEHYHTAQYDSDGSLMSWLIDEAGPFDTVMNLQANWWLSAPLVEGWRAYLTAAVLDRAYAQSNGALPGSANAMAIDAYLDYYAYSGDARFLDMVKTIGDYTLQQGLTPSTYTAYPGFPWPVGETGNITPDGSGQPNNVTGSVMPDKGAMIGNALLKLYEATGDTRYLDEAVHIADVLAAQAVTGTAIQSPWPFRVMADTGEMIDGPLVGNQSFALRLYDELLRLGITGNGSYQSTRDNVWNWLENVAIADTTGDKWQHFFEDKDATGSNSTQFDALETARYLIQKKDEVDPQWFALATSIINTVKSRWVLHTGDFTAIAEQDQDLSAYNSHTARYASILSLLYEAGGPVEYKDEAYSSLAYSAYSVDTDGFPDTYYDLDNAWSTDSFGDWMKHFVTALGAVPEWAPNNASHLLSSTSVLQHVAYGDGTVDYTTFDSTGREKLKLNFTPGQVQVEGVPVNTWNWNGETHVLVIDRTTGKSVTVLAGADTNPPARSNGAPSGTLAAGTTSASMTLTTSELATCRYATVPGIPYAAMALTFGTTGGTAHATGVSGLSDGGSYNFYVRCSDGAGNANLDDYIISFCVALPDGTPPTISAVSATAQATTATVRWTTDEVADSQVEYGLTNAYGQQTTKDTILVTDHSQNIIGLAPGTTYHYRVLSADASGNLARSVDATFTTAAIDLTGLVAAYSMNAGAGTTLEDVSGNNHTGTLTNGPTWTASGKYGGAISFDGTDDFITVNDADTLDLTTGLTLMAWVNPSANTGWRTVILKERPGGLAYSLYANDDTAGPPSLTLSIGSDRVVLGNLRLPLNTWSHLAATYDGTTMRIYVNGLQVGSAARTGSVTTSVSPLRIGGNTIWGEHFQGVIDEIRIYNRALPASEIQQAMNTPL